MNRLQVQLVIRLDRDKAHVRNASSKCQRAQVESIFRSPIRSVHRWQAHLLDEGAIARVGMEKVESGVRLNQEQQ
jgi:hypothetical protein